MIKPKENRTKQKNKLEKKTTNGKTYQLKRNTKTKQNEGKQTKMEENKKIIKEKHQR